MHGTSPSGSWKSSALALAVASRLASVVFAQSTAPARPTAAAGPLPGSSEEQLNRLAAEVAELKAAIAALQASAAPA